MNLTKVLSHLEFQPSDYILSDSDFSMTPKFIEVESEQVDVIPAKPSPEQLQAAWEEVQLKECDIALLVNEYVKDAQRDPENDCLNIVDGLLHSFTFTHIAKPTNAQLLALKSVVEAKVSQEEINAAAIKYLAETDYLVIRSVDDPSKPVSDEVKALRQAARDSIVK